MDNDIAVASELMAILALVDGKRLPVRSAQSARAMRPRRHRIEQVGRSGHARGTSGLPARWAVLMKDTLHPTLMQTLEGQAAFVHAGPFANIRARQIIDSCRPGCSSPRRLRRDRVRLRCRHGHGEVPRHQVPRLGPQARLRCDGGHGPGLEDAWWRAKSGAGSSAGGGSTWRRTCRCCERGSPT